MAAVKNALLVAAGTRADGRKWSIEADPRRIVIKYGRWRLRARIADQGRGVSLVELRSDEAIEN